MKQKLKLTQLIRKHWKNNYLSHLQERKKWLFKKSNILPRMLVLFKYSQLPIYTWSVSCINKVLSRCWWNNTEVRTVFSPRPDWWTTCLSSANEWWNLGFLTLEQTTYLYFDIIINKSFTLVSFLLLPLSKIIILISSHGLFWLKSKGGGEYF